MFAALALAAVLLPAHPTPADLPDLVAFHGITRDVAALNRDATDRHTREVLGRLPDDRLRWGWECRQDQVWHAWAALAGALDTGAPPGCAGRVAPPAAIPDRRRGVLRRGHAEPGPGLRGVGARR